MATPISTIERPILTEARMLLQRARAPRLRTMRQFAEQEIIIPDGPHAGRKFRCERQPITGLLFDALASGAWRRHFITGPTQSGKTLTASLIPIMYHLFEVGETVIWGVPDLNMIHDKWHVDLKPLIERSRYRDLLPGGGGGSRGGTPQTIQLNNGAAIRFMTGGGNDKTRAGFTARVVMITETDGMDEPGEKSREADPIRQLEARTRAYGDQAVVYSECTVSTDDGRTWQEYLAGTQSKILPRCPHCERWVEIKREHLVGWKEARSIIEAAENARWSCPNCGRLWDELERRQAVHDARLIHAGQTIDERGELIGEPKPTDTLGFRWSAVHNLFAGTETLAQDEWHASHSAQEQMAEREMKQFVWALPYEKQEQSLSSLDALDLIHRMAEPARGLVPSWATALTLGIDIGKYLCHWALIAWRDHAAGHIVDYGRLEVASETMGEERGILTALREFRDEMIEPGWGWQDVRDADDPAAMRRSPDRVWIDCNYFASTESVYLFCRESGFERYLPMRGQGESQAQASRYRPPKRNATGVIRRGEGYWISRLDARTRLVNVNADQWKSWLHERLSTPLGAPGNAPGNTPSDAPRNAPEGASGGASGGAMTLYAAPKAQDHLTLARHLTAERPIEEFDPRRGTIIRWERIHRNNHWLDACYMACAAGYDAGVRLIADASTNKRSPRSLGEAMAQGRRKQRRQGFAASSAKGGWR